MGHAGRWGSLLLVGVALAVAPPAAARLPTTEEARRSAHAYLERMEREGYTYSYEIRRCKGSVKRTPSWSPWRNVPHAWCDIRQWYREEHDIGVIDDVLVVEWIRGRRRCHLSAWTMVDWTDNGVPYFTEKVPARCAAPRSVRY